MYGTRLPVPGMSSPRGNSSADAILIPVSSLYANRLLSGAQTASMPYFPMSNEAGWRPRV